MLNTDEISAYIEEIKDRHNIPKRISELDLILDVFKTQYQVDYNIEINFIDSASEVIALLYYYLIEKEIKGYLDNNSNIFKMASATELIINYVQPIISSSSDQKNLRRLNAELASYSAVSFVSGWKDVDFYLGSGIHTLNDSMDTFLNERLKILENMDIKNRTLPILFNSQSWELFYLIVSYFRSASMMR